MARGGTWDFNFLNEVHVGRVYRRFEHFIREGSTVIDVGAQIGTFSVHAGSLAQGVRVLSFEPLSDNYRLLERNIELNGQGGRVRAFNSGVGAESGRSRLYLNARNSGGHSMFGEGPSVEIDLFTLEQVFEINQVERCDFLKLDCEGAEYQILHEAPTSILDVIQSISLEYHAVHGDVVALAAYLESKGFAVDVTLDDAILNLLFAQRR